MVDGVRKYRLGYRVSFDVECTEAQIRDFEAVLAAAVQKEFPDANVVGSWVMAKREGSGGS